MRARRASIFCTLLIVATPALAEQEAARTAEVTTEQIAPNGQATLPAINISDLIVRDDRVLPQIGKPETAVGAVDQLQPRIRAHSGTAQATSESAQATGSPQLGRKERSTRGAQPISAPSDGRQTAIVKIGGRDRCDPQAPNAGSAACRSVIETRSAEFKAPSAPVASPEQRLLIDQERAEMRTVRGAVQRVGRNDVNADAIETQTLAAIAGARPAEDPQAQAIDPISPTGLEAIIQIIGAAQGAQNPN